MQPPGTNAALDSLVVEPEPNQVGPRDYSVLPPREQGNREIARGVGEFLAHYH
jgi:hypothetical protein